MDNKLKLTKGNITKVLKGAALSATGVFVDAISQAAFNFDYGEYTPLVYAIVPVIVNVVRKFISKE